jgi:hypothetical protein
MYDYKVNRSGNRYYVIVSRPDGQGSIGRFFNDFDEAFAWGEAQLARLNAKA